MKASYDNHLWRLRGVVYVEGFQFSCQKSINFSILLSNHEDLFDI